MQYSSDSPDTDASDVSDALPEARRIATGTLRGGRRFAALFCSPRVGPLHYPAEASHMLDTGCLDAAADLSQGGTLASLRACLERFSPHVVWFVGHGDLKLCSERTLGWTQPDGELELMEPQVVADALASHAPCRGGSLECVVLNSCSTCGLAHMASEAGVPIVVGWASRVPDLAASAWARGFLRALQRGAPYRACFEAGKAATLETTEAARPGLATRSNPLLSGPCAAARVQKYELNVDPSDVARVVQPGDVLGRGWHGRVRPGTLGEGRIAAGRPLLLERHTAPPRGVPCLPPLAHARAALLELVAELCRPAPRAAPLAGAHALGLPSR